MRWLGDVRSREGVAERGFEVAVDGRQVPGVLWTPDGATGPRPLVLIGHGATRHKRVDYVVALARRLAGDHGFAAAAIDGPGHGDRMLPGRRNDFEVFSDFLAEWSRAGTTDDMVADWTTTLEALRRLDHVGDGPVGYWGLSMGTIYGIPLAAAEPRIQVAVFGLMGLVGPTRDGMAADARRLSCPVLLLQQWDDSLIPREHVFELFDSFGSLDKRLHAHPGDHAAVPIEEMVFSARFLVRHLGPGGDDPG
ncbi:MAG: alpha/beta hydrolase [Actinomycetota bacterium]|nr:alpha/beta hydrolase [Actinomycetota bacterium]